jgi:hypothetical protein
LDLCLIVYANLIIKFKGIIGKWKLSFDFHPFTHYIILDGHNVTLTTDQNQWQVRTDILFQNIVCFAGLKLFQLSRNISHTMFYFYSVSKNAHITNGYCQKLVFYIDQTKRVDLASYQCWILNNDKFFFIVNYHQSMDKTFI